jgi:hypothetical protein
VEYLSHLAGGYKLTWARTDAEERESRTNNTESELYDMVIIASPLTSDMSQLKLTNMPPLPPAVSAGRYHHTYTYLINGQLNGTRLGGGDGTAAVADDHFFIDPTERIASLSRLVPVDSSESEDSTLLPDVYKMFSREPLKQADIEEFFTQIHSFQTVNWPAYPFYPSNKEHTYIQKVCISSIILMVDMEKSRLSSSLQSCFNFLY